MLTPDTSYNVGFFLYGPSGTGKSVFLSILIGLVGEENTCCVPLGDFESRFGTWPLTTHLLNAVGDMPAMPESGWSANVEGCYKDVTDGRLIPIEHKFMDPSKAKVTARNVFATNELPYFADRSGAIRDRLRVIPFKQRFRNTAKQNSHLTEELLEELPGILNWAIQGLVRLRELTALSDVKTFPHCEEGRQAVEDYLGSCDHEQEFLLEATESNPESMVGSLRLYDEYKEWATRRGYHAVAIKKFVDAVKWEYPNATFPRKNDEHKRKITFIQGISLLPFS